MGVSALTHQYLSNNEGLTFFHELIEYVETDTWKIITDNMRCPPMIPDPTNTDQMIHQEAFLLSAKSLGRPRIAAVVVSLFSMTYRPLSTGIMMYDYRLKNFKMHMDSIKEKKKNEINNPPNCLGILPLKSTPKDSMCIWEVILER